MNALHQTFTIQADRPLLGTFALAACLAGATATQNHAGVPRAIGTARYAGGWEAGAPRQPDRTIAAMAATLVPAAAAKPIGTVRHAPLREHRRLAQPVKARDTKPIEPLPTSRSAAVRIADLALPSSAPLVVQVESAAPLPGTAASIGAVPPPAELATVSASAAVPTTAVARTIDDAQPQTDSAPLKLVNSPEIRRFDLAKFTKAPPRAAKLAASRKPSANASAKARPADRLIDGVVYHHASVEVAGQAGGDIAVRIGPDMKPSVKVADLLGLVSAQMDPDALARFHLASSANDYVSFATLRSAGFEVKYNAAADSIAISVAP